MLDPNRRSERSLKELSVYIRVTHTHTHIFYAYSWLKYSEQKKETCTDYATESVSRVTLREQFLFKQRVLLVPRDNVDDSRVCSPLIYGDFPREYFMFRWICLDQIFIYRKFFGDVAKMTLWRAKRTQDGMVTLEILWFYQNGSTRWIDFFFTLESNSPEQASNVA